MRIIVNLALTIILFVTEQYTVNYIRFNTLVGEVYQNTPFVGLNLVHVRDTGLSFEDMFDYLLIFILLIGAYKMRKIRIIYISPLPFLFACCFGKIFNYFKMSYTLNYLQIANTNLNLNLNDIYLFIAMLVYVIILLLSRFYPKLAIHR